MGFIRKDLCNWTPWIVSNVMLTACAWAGDRARLCAILERGCRMLDRYLDCLPADGGCDEGPGYWSMAGGALLDCLELLERVTGGRMAFWQEEKLQSVLRFPRSVWLGGDWFANFADCDAKPDVPGERLQFAGQKLGDPALAAFGARFRGDPAALIEDTPQLWRLLNAVFHTPEIPADSAIPPADVWLPDLQLRILRRDGVTLVCKGGANAGGHSHNDCGSFMVYADGEPQIVDAGNMTYTGKTFSEARYTLWNTRGRNHNIPMIGGFEQVDGQEHRARDVQPLPDGLALELADAWPKEAGVLSCRRVALCSPGQVQILDEVKTREPAAVTEVLLLRHRPEIEGGAVAAGRVRIAVELEVAVQIEEIPIDDPRMAKSFPGSLWRLAFTAPAAKERTIRMTVEHRQGS